MYVFHKKLCISLSLVTVLLLFLSTHVGSARYTSKELEELRKYYYDDVDPPESSEESRHGHNKNDPPRKSESRSSSSSKPTKKSDNENSDEDDKSDSSKEKGKKDDRDSERSSGPLQFIEDTRKFLDEGRKNIERGAQRVFTPLPLPRIRLIRASFNLKFGKDEKSHSDSEANGGDDGGESMREVAMHKHAHRSARDQEEDDSVISSISAFPTEGPPSSPSNKGNKNGRIGKGDDDDESPLDRFGNRASEVAADTGGRILSILNRLTPPPFLGLPTLAPNLEDFGG